MSLVSPTRYKNFEAFGPVLLSPFWGLTVPVVARSETGHNRSGYFRRRRHYRQAGQTLHA